jgi:hypothetical protein
VVVASAVCCVPAVRGWHGGRWLEFMRYFGTRGIMRGRYADAYAAAVVPLILGGTTMFAGGVLFLWLDHFGVDRPLAWLIAIPLIVAGAVGLGLFAALYLFMWPTRLVPPPLRGARGVFSRDK